MIQMNRIPVTPNVTGDNMQGIRKMGNKGGIGSGAKTIAVQEVRLYTRPAPIQIMQ